MTDDLLRLRLASNCKADQKNRPRIQKLLKAYPVIDFRWQKVQGIMIAPKFILASKNKPFIYISFGYTHFEELISRN